MCCSLSPPLKTISDWQRFGFRTENIQVLMLRCTTHPHTRRGGLAVMEADIFHVFACLWLGRGWLMEGGSCTFVFSGVFTCLGLQMARSLLLLLDKNRNCIWTVHSTGCQWRQDKEWPSKRANIVVIVVDSYSFKDIAVQLVTQSVTIDVTTDLLCVVQLLH